MKNRIKLIIILAFLVATFYCLFIQPELLSINISKSLNFPLGSLIVWTGVISYAILAQFFLSSSSKSKLFIVGQVMRRIHFGLAMLWLPVSYALSGNLAFVFKNKQNAYEIWKYYTLLILLIPVILLLIKLVYKSKK
ncbi:hypothetical protein [uncultured Draconibacterium sp.]|uniref:hypothetical protein n=1 Tax=uncultured Draconibacterium sp. TaxID=1573823 RepID=UPI002AA961F7|nr:hypothetical protein [uncultured Draconibacterium sp.]